MTTPALVLQVAGKPGQQNMLRYSGVEARYTFGRGYNFDNSDPAVIMIPDEGVS